MESSLFRRFVFWSPSLRHLCLCFLAARLWLKLVFIKRVAPGFTACTIRSVKGLTLSRPLSVCRRSQEGTQSVQCRNEGPTFGTRSYKKVLSLKPRAQSPEEIKSGEVVLG